MSASILSSQLKPLELPSLVGLQVMDLPEPISVCEKHYSLVWYILMVDIFVVKLGSLLS